MTDLEEQKLLEEAQNGDPKAKFELSLWARQIAPLKPDEEKWNRLAAACLVDAAKAGYEPAVQMVQQLMGASAPTAKPTSTAEKTEADVAEEALETAAAVEETEDEPEAAGDIFDRLFADLDDVNIKPAPAKAAEEAPADETPASEEDEVLPGFTLDPEKVEPQIYIPYTDPDFADYEEEEEQPLPPSFVDKAKDLAAGLLDQAKSLLKSWKKPPVSKMSGDDVLVGEVSFASELTGDTDTASDTAAETSVEASPKAVPEEILDDLSDELPQDRTAARAQASGGNWMNRVLDWVGDNWKIARIALIAIVVVMAILVVLLLLPKGTFQKEPEPTPTPIPTATPEPTPTPEPFPNEATRNEIAATAVLDYRPEEGEFLTASASYSVNSEDGMNMRSGPGTDYDVLARLANEQMVTAYARYTTGEETWYLVNTGGNWGWVISDYLQ